MKGNFTLTLLNALEHEKKGSKDKFYTLSFLDENDKSYNCYISPNIFESCKGLKRFDEVDICLSIYTDKDGKYQFNVVSVEKNPFKNEENKK